MEPSTLGQRLEHRDAGRFVGRERELAFLESLLGDDPAASVVFVHGPGGIGKSTLLRELARRARRHERRTWFVDGRRMPPAPGALEAALQGASEDERPLLLFDSWERISAAGAHLRARVLPSLPAQAVVVIAGRAAPDPDWFADGWESIVADIALEPLPADQAGALLGAHGVAPGPQRSDPPVGGGLAARAGARRRRRERRPRLGRRRPRPTGRTWSAPSCAASPAPSSTAATSTSRPSPPSPARRPAACCATSCPTWTPRRPRRGCAR